MRYMSEARALRKLKIKNWRYLTKEHFIKFTSIIPKLDKEVALKAIEHFPDLSNTARQTLSDFRNTLSEAQQCESKSTEKLLSMINSQIETLQVFLQNDNLSINEKFELISEINTLIDQAKELHYALLRSNLSRQLFHALVALGIFLGLASFIGVNTNAKLGNDFEDEDDEEM